MEPTLKQQHRTLIILWFALIMSVVMYFVFLIMVRPQNSVEPQPNSPVIIGLTAIAFMLVIAGFLIKRKYLERAVDQQDLVKVRTGHIIGWALCEVPALLAIVQRMVFGFRGYYWLLLLSGLSIGIQFPRFEQLQAASFKTNNRDL
jgi:hypothetical protein